eukprot:jgi/Psemu1/242720/estExt_Genewise1.C_3000033
MVFDMWGNNEHANKYPGEDTSKKLYTNIEKLAAKEMYEMRSDQRESILLELHGVKSRAVAESPELIESSLETFETILQTVRCKERDTDINGKTHPLDQGHLRATNDLQSKYVTSPEFRLRFLRAELFDVKKAVARYYKNLNYMFDLFGDIGLVRQVHLSDLSNQEQKYLKSGKVRCSTSRDKVGRRMMIFSEVFPAPLLERIRVETYLMFAVISEDEATQKCGSVNIIILSFSKNSAISFDPEERTLAVRAFDSAPLRPSAIHLCMPDETIYKFLGAIVQSLLSRDMRAVTRAHTGSPMECNYALGQFGIPVNSFPKATSGSLTIKSIQKFFKARIAIEEYQKKRCQLLDCPDLNCIVFGDRVFYNHPGNVKFREYLKGRTISQDQRKEEQKLQKRGEEKEKQRIDGNFLDDIIDKASTTCQFAFYDKGIGWYAYIRTNNPSDRQELRKRISQLIRDERKRDRTSTWSIPMNDDGGRSTEDNSTYLHSEASTIGLDAKRFKTSEGCGGCGNWSELR